MKTTDTLTRPAMQPRLSPIENPGSLRLKLAYWLTGKMFGKIITPLKVHYARFPAGLGLAQSMVKVQNKLTLHPRTQYLIKVYIATLNGCSFCVDIGKASAGQKNLAPGFFDQVLNFESSSEYTEQEKAALRYVDETTRNKHVADDTYDRLKEHYSEEEIVQITMLNAIENYYNLMNAPLNIGSDELCELLN